MVVPYRHYEIAVWFDDSNALNYELRNGENGFVMAGGYDLVGSMTRDEAVERMKKAADEYVPRRNKFGSTH